MDYQFAYDLMMIDWNNNEEKKERFYKSSLFLRKKFNDTFNIIRQYVEEYIYRNETKIEYIERKLLPKNIDIYNKFVILLREQQSNCWKKWRRNCLSIH